MPPKDMSSASTGLAMLVERMEACRVASREDLEGCSDEEIARLERRYSVNLPESYRSFLKVMGHRSGRLFRYDHWAGTYEYVLNLTEEERETAKRAGADAAQKLDAILGTDGLIILGRLGEQFLFVHCDEGDEPAVHYFENYAWETKKAYSSVMEWLDFICDECVDAIKSGYFEKYPDGTRP
jgi:hypothetical protein